MKQSFKNTIINAGAAFLLAAAIHPVYSVNWQELGFTVKEKSEKENNYEYILSKDGKNMTVKSFEKVKDDDAARISDFINQTKKFEYIEYDTITFMMKNDALNASLIPTSFLYEKKSYIPYIPAGLQFIITSDSIQYNYRIKKDSYFIKIKGDFVDDALIAQKMKKAVENPSLYIKQRDPEFMANKLELLQEELDSLKASHTRLSQNHEMLRIALMTLHNKGFFSSEKQISANLITKIVDYKKKFPDASIDDVEKYLEKDKIEASDREIKIIFFVYFNEFKDD